MDQLLPPEIVEAGQTFPAALAACGDLDALLRLKGAYIGREASHATRLMELLKTAPKEQKRELGAAINGLKQQWEEGLKARQTELEAAKRNRSALAATWDPALPPPQPPRGALHPLNRLMDRLVDVFRPLGFHVEEGPEVETEAHNFDGLNIPEDHPAKASSDTFYLAAHPELLLRTHTSPVQVRTLLRVAPDLAARGGIRFLAPGRVYRKDEIDPPTAPCSTRSRACSWAMASACSTSRAPWNTRCAPCSVRTRRSACGPPTSPSWSPAVRWT